MQSLKVFILSPDLYSCTFQVSKILLFSCKHASWMFHKAKLWILKAGICCEDPVDICSLNYTNGLYCSTPTHMPQQISTEQSRKLQKRKGRDIFKRVCKYGKEPHELFSFHGVKLKKIYIK